MIYRISVILFFLLVSFSGFSTKINGTTYTPFAGKTVNLIEYTDYITREYRILQTTQIDANGKFVFDYDFKQTQQAIIQIEYLIGIIYLEPNQEYFIKFPPKSEDGTYKLTRNNVNLIFETIPPNDINGLILEFDKIYDQFLMENRYLVGRKIFHSKIDSLKQLTEKQFAGVKNDYFKNYAKFNIANLELVTPASHQKVNKLALYNTYILNKKIDIKHPVQMGFISKFYEKTLQNQQGIVGAKIYKAINENPSFIALDTLLEKDYFFKMDFVRELVIVENLFSMYYSQDYSKQNLLDIMWEAKVKANDIKVREIAVQLTNTITKLLPGSKAFPFSLANSYGDTIKLRELEGKYVYINFWAAWNTESLAEMDVLKKMNAEYGDFVEFVSINIDAQKRKFDVFCNAHPEYNWNMLYYQGDANLLDKYEIYSIPSYVLIDPKGNIISGEALKPIPNGTFNSIEKFFFDTKKELAPKRRFSIGGK